MPKNRQPETRQRDTTTLVWAASRKEIVDLVGVLLGYPGRNLVATDNSIRNPAGKVVPCLRVGVSPVTGRAKLVWVSDLGIPVSGSSTGHTEPEITYCDETDEEN